MKQVVAWVAGAAAAGAVVLVASLIAPTPEPDAPVPPAPAPVADIPAEPAEVAAELAAPRVLELRVEPDGLAVVAGSAAPGEDVALIVDGAEVDRVQAGADGQFAAILSLPPAATPRVLTLLADPAGRAAAAEGTVIIAPVAQEMAAQAADPAAADIPAVTQDPIETVAATVPSDDVPSLQDAGPNAPAAADVVPAEPVAAEPVPDAATPPAPAEPEIAATEPAEEEVTPAPPAETAPVEPPPAETAQAAPEPAQAPLAEAEQPDAPEPEPEPVAEPEPVTVASTAAQDTSPEPQPVVIAGDASGGAFGLAVVSDAPPVTGAATGPGGAGDAAPPSLAPPQIAPDVPQPPAPPADVVVDIPPVLAADAAGVRVLQPAIIGGAGPEVAATVALDAISYDDGGEVTLAGRAQGTGVVRLYLDNAPVAVAELGPSGWQAVLPDVPAGVYTLRIDQIDDAGGVVSRIETPFQREGRDAIAAAMADQTGTGFGVAVKTVQPGHTLWAIARDRYGEGVMYVEVFAANRDRIRDPDLIYPGQVFVLPELPGETAP